VAFPTAAHFVRDIRRYSNHPAPVNPEILTLWKPAASGGIVAVKGFGVFLQYQRECA
jgi:hypothetical protein